MHEANIPSELWRTKKEVRLNGHKLFERFENIKKSKKLCLILTGANLQKRWIAASLCLKKAALQGMSVYSNGIIDIVNSEFEDREEIRKAVKRDIVWLRFDTSRNHSWEYPVLIEVLTKRVGRLTIVTVRKVIKVPVSSVSITI